MTGKSRPGGVMKVSRQQAAENRDAILRVASAQIRERGLGQVSAAEVAKAAGLTHGALYSHFSSKEALVTAAIAQAYEQTATGFAGLSAEDLVGRYLSPEHRDHAGCGCPSAALVSEVPSQSGAVQAAFAEGAARFARVIADSLGSGDAGSDQGQILFMFAAMVGGLAIARAVRAQDPVASDAMLQAVASRLRQTVLPADRNEPHAADGGAKRRRAGKPRPSRRPKPREPS
jgi:TetR/AcrR family transcriptional repressor of nem operon